MAVPSHLTIKTDKLQFDLLLADWQWLLKEKFTPLVMTTFGDVFLQNTAGQIYFLDLISGNFKQVAPTKEHFDQICESQEQRRNWFIGSLVMELLKIHGSLAPGQCYGCKIALSLGGQLECSNFEPTDIQVHFSVLGQLHQQTKHLPPATKIGNVKIS